jgi:hypothetical protein
MAIEGQHAAVQVVYELTQSPEDRRWEADIGFGSG